MLKNCIVSFRKKEKYYELSYKTGATHIDSWVDIEGGFGTFSPIQVWQKNASNTPFG